MIFDELKNLSHYKGLHENLDKAIAYLESHDLTGLALGRYDIDGDKVFLIIQDNPLNKEESPVFEFHERYADLHLLLEGNESIGYGYQLKEITTPYKEEAEIGFATCQEGYALHLTRENFAVFLPGEFHQPTGYAGQEDRVRKCLLKILMN